MLPRTKVVWIAGTQVDTLIVLEVAGVGLCTLYGFEAVFNIHGNVWEYDAEGDQGGLIFPRR